MLILLNLLFLSTPYTVAAAYDQPGLNFPSALQALQESDLRSSAPVSRVFRSSGCRS
jgi:hypothetical protein